MFLPGSVSINYGQEIGLITPLNADTALQQTPMRWSSGKNFGFSNVDGQLFFPISEESVIDFETQYKNPKSALRAFKRLAEIRTRDPIFLNGHLKIVKLNNLIVFLRFLADIKTNVSFI